MLEKVKIPRITDVINSKKFLNILIIELLLFTKIHLTSPQHSRENCT